jgi:hypothetical protein
MSTPACKPATQPFHHHPLQIVTIFFFDPRSTCHNPLNLANPPLNLHPGSTESSSTSRTRPTPYTEQFSVSSRPPSSGCFSPPAGLGVNTHSRLPPRPQPVWLTPRYFLTARTTFRFPSPFAHFPNVRPRGLKPPARSRVIRSPQSLPRPWPRSFSLPRSWAPRAPHPHRRSHSSSLPGRGRLPGSRRRRVRTARLPRTTRRLTGTEWPPTTPPWLRKQGRERAEERCGAGEREGKQNNRAAGFPKCLLCLLRGQTPTD